MTENEDKSEWYKGAADYWSKVEPNDNGMLGGYSRLTSLDATTSLSFISSVKTKRPEWKHERALDCGAGVGRVTRNLLSKVFECVDLLEQDPKFLKVAETELSDLKIGNFFCLGLQSVNEDFVKANDVRYDCIWLQWVTGYLTSADFVSFLNTCKLLLKPNGLVYIKDNVTDEGFVVDKQDNSVTRSEELLRDIFSQSGFSVVKSQVQRNFPSDLFKVVMYALEPNQS